VLGGCCTSAAFCNDLFVDHCIEIERQGVVLHHLLNGMCVSRPNVPSCSSLGRHAASAMHLSYKTCTLLLFGRNRKQLTQRVFGLCCMSLNLNSGGSDHKRDLPRKLQQRVTRWAPLYDCGTAVDMIPHIESFGSGSLLLPKKTPFVTSLFVTSFSGNVRPAPPRCATRSAAPCFHLSSSMCQLI